MDKTVLNQALKLRDGVTYSKVVKLCNAIKEYEKQNDIIFLYAKPRQSVEILDEASFFEYISTEVVQKDNSVNSFEDIENILNSSSREENQEKTGNTKSSFIRVFDKVVVFQRGFDNPVLYKDTNDIECYGVVLAVENGEVFLDVASRMTKYGFENFVYLGGFANTLTREFLRDKDVVFFLDFDIEAIRIYDSFECKSKKFFRPDDIEDYFQNYSNQTLYKKQRKSLPDSHKELDWLIELIKRYSVVVEQEAIR